MDAVTAATATKRDVLRFIVEEGLDRLMRDWLGKLMNDRIGGDAYQLIPPDK